MKVGTDGVLLGSWADVNGAHTALDIGTGSGLIALMLAQRNENLVVDAIDIDEDAVEQAKENINGCPFRDRISAFQADFTRYMGMNGRYDLIVSNPPFYVEHTSCPDIQRNVARHPSSLPLEKLMSGASHLLMPQGVFALIVPTSVSDDILTLAGKCGLNLCRRTDVITSPHKVAKRVLLEFSPASKEPVLTSLLIRNGDNEYSPEFRQLTSQFYL